MSAATYPSGATVVCDAPVHSDAWHEARRHGIGSSDASAVMGVNPWATPTAVYIDKIEGLGRDDNEAMYWGRVLEDIVATEFGIRTGAHVAPSPGILAHPHRPWQRAALDRDIVDEDGPALLECKTTDGRHAGDWDDGNVPAHYLIQVHHQLAVTGYDHAWIACLIGGNSYTHIRVAADPGIAEMLLETEQRFWASHVLARQVPPLDGSTATRELLRRLYPTAEPDTRVELGPAEARPWIETHRRAKAAEADAKARAREAENHLTAMLGEAELGFIDGRQAISWKTVQRDGYVVEPTAYRRFHILKGF